MSKVFLEREKAAKEAVQKGETLDEFLQRMKDKNACAAELTWEQFALYNWATKEPKEVNRALIELVGCAVVDEKDPSHSQLDPALGLGQPILVPKPWSTPKGLELEKTHTVKIKQRLPAPAVAITTLSQWFEPETENCEIEYSLEGVTGRADKADFEVHVTKYFDRDKDGMLVDAKPHIDKSLTYLLQRRKDYEEKDPVTNPLPPKAPRKIAGTWKGDSEATVGVLKQNVPATYINCACAPYTVLIRYYKDESDKQAKITLNTFFPCWKAPVGGVGSPTLVDSSLKVKWAIAHDNGKLQVGQLRVWDKNDKLVFRAVLDKEKLQGGEYDLLNEKVSWEKAKIKQADMPYRVQLQAHSDMDQDNGLALAVMHTEVRTFKYDQVQFIAFNTKPGTRTLSSGAKAYLGDSDDDTDITRRCAIMVDAIKVAYANTNIDKSKSVLKLFMAPEFYFRGTKGGYEIENVSSIMDKLQTETEKARYADWLFVFGTAIGFLKHEELDSTGKGTGKPLVHTDVATIVDQDTTKQWLLVESRICSQMIKNNPNLTATAIWKVRQAGKVGNVKQCLAHTTKDQYWLQIESGTAWAANGPVELIEPIATEVFNIALVQKGWPFTTPCAEQSLKKAIIYKESVSAIDFIGKYSDDINAWFDASGRGRKIQIHGKKDRPVLPTAGSAALLGPSPNVPSSTPTKWTDKAGIEHTIGSEINVSGIGGGSVFTIDEITFGLEVCLDHMEDKLGKFYNAGAATGDPKVQIQLIPSWGMTIGEGEICCVDDGLIFNVDGSRCESAARLYDSRWSCNEHPDQSSDSPGTCGATLEFWACPTCNALKGGRCTKHTIAPVKYFKCDNCDRLYVSTATDCPSCSTPAVPKTCNANYQQIGTGLTHNSVATAMSPARYFEEDAGIEVYEVKDIPAAEVV